MMFAETDVIRELSDDGERGRCFRCRSSKRDRKALPDLSEAKRVAVTALILFGCGSQQERVILLEEIVPTCPSVESTIVDVEVARDAVRPDHAGYYMRSCNPDHPRSNGHEAFVYDGSYVTLIGVDRSTYEPPPPLRFYDQQRAFKLESRWDDDRLLVHVPPWLTYEDDHVSWVEIARLQEERLVDPHGVPFERTDHPMHTAPWRHLGEQHAAVTDYDAPTNARGRLLFEFLSRVLGRCVGAQHSGQFVLLLDADGLVLEGGLSGDDEDAHACIRSVIEAQPVIEGYAAPSSARVRIAFGSSQ